MFRIHAVRDIARMAKKAFGSTAVVELPEDSVRQPRLVRDVDEGATGGFRASPFPTIAFRSIGREKVDLGEETIADRHQRNSRVVYGRRPGIILRRTSASWIFRIALDLSCELRATPMPMRSASSKRLSPSAKTSRIASRSF